MKGVTNELIKILKTVEDNSLRIAKRNILTVGTLFSKTKDRSPNFQDIEVVYKIQCRNCDETYIGQTSRSLKNGLSAYKSDIRTGRGSCALVKHSMETDQRFQFDDTITLGSETFKAKGAFVDDEFIKPIMSSTTGRTFKV
ncbi:hypothetical protein WA026_022243 [Henosepilachna vigintioctopunctata]|uniref:GIY-YIG homing endonuclease n=1 Tax=Henosepilachna vigintioctopunctata TaxID=420089 RepID=A0AAW1UN62_9CUCU